MHGKNGQNRAKLEESLNPITVTKIVTTPTLFHAIPAKTKGLKPSETGALQQVTALISGFEVRHSIQLSYGRTYDSKGLME